MQRDTIVVGIVIAALGIVVALISCGLAFFSTPYFLLGLWPASTLYMIGVDKTTPRFSHVYYPGPYKKLPVFKQEKEDEKSLSNISDEENLYDLPLEIALKGLGNSGNNCWLNASLQMLFAFFKEDLKLFFNECKEIINLDQASFKKALENQDSSLIKYLKSSEKLHLLVKDFFELLPSNFGHGYRPEIQTFFQECAQISNLPSHAFKELLNDKKSILIQHLSENLTAQEKIKLHFRSFAPLKNLYNKYFQNNQKPLSSTDVQSVRALVHMLSPYISENYREQEDAHEGFTALMQILIDGGFVSFNVIRIEHREFIQENNRFNSETIPAKAISQEPIATIELPDQQEIISLSQLFKNRQFTAHPEPLEESYINNIQNRVQMVATELVYQTLPDSFCCNIKRFAFNKATRQESKIKTPLSFDNITLTSDACSGSISKTYEVDGIVVHSGSSSRSGHYYTYLKKNNQWYQLNDSEVSLCQGEPVIKNHAQAYILHLSTIAI